MTDLRARISKKPEQTKTLLVRANRTHAQVLDVDRDPDATTVPAEELARHVGTILDQVSHGRVTLVFSIDRGSTGVLTGPQPIPRDPRQPKGTDALLALIARMAVLEQEALELATELGLFNAPKH